MVCKSHCLIACTDNFTEYLLEENFWAYPPATNYLLVNFHREVYGQVPEAPGGLARFNKVAGQFITTSEKGILSPFRASVPCLTDDQFFLSWLRRRAFYTFLCHRVSYRQWWWTDKSLSIYVMGQEGEFEWGVVLVEWVTCLPSIGRISKLVLYPNVLNSLSGKCNQPVLWRSRR